MHMNDIWQSLCALLKNENFCTLLKFTEYFTLLG